MWVDLTSPVRDMVKYHRTDVILQHFLVIFDLLVSNSSLFCLIQFSNFYLTLTIPTNYIRGGTERKDMEKNNKLNQISL